MLFDAIQEEHDFSLITVRKKMFHHGFRACCCQYTTTAEIAQRCLLMLSYNIINDFIQNKIVLFCIFNIQVVKYCVNLYFHALVWTFLHFCFVFCEIQYIFKGHTQYCKLVQVKCGTICYVLYRSDQSR